MKIKSLLGLMAGLLLFPAPGAQAPGQEASGDLAGLFSMAEKENRTVKAAKSASNAITIFMCGDVMTGRGIDQILPHPGDPVIYESYMKSARGYVKIAEDVNGPIDYPVSFSYIWGDALAELDRIRPHVRLINLETSVTKSSDYWKGKGINYRMHPENIPIFKTAGIDICALANNHVLDWGYAGLLETLDSLNKAHIKTAGAGRNLLEAQAPAVHNVPERGRVVVFSFGLETSGIPSDWQAGDKKPGVNLLTGMSTASLREIQERIRRVKQNGDIMVASVHWGSNWGFKIPGRQVDFAHNLIDEAGVDIVHGHSSHHVRAIEVYRDKLILYGCGDFINDYEGIAGHEEYRADLSLMYFAIVDPSTGKLLALQMTPTRMKKFKVHGASKPEALWLKDTLTREGARFGTKVKFSAGNRLTLQWD